jgi:6-phosphogluconolactonase
MHPFLRLASVVTLGCTCAAGVVAADSKAPPPAKEFQVFFGTYTGEKSRGIYRARLDVATGRLSSAELAAETRNPSFLAVHPSGFLLYAIDEGSDPVRTPGRGVRAYGVNGPTGVLTFLNEQSSGSAGPCHLTVGHDGRTVLVANYSGGSVAVLPLDLEGRLSAPAVVSKHVGASVHPTRQKQSHAHAINVSPDNRFALAPDLGIDQVRVYRFDAAKAMLTPNTPSAVSLPPGSGPRHLAFHPNGRFVYVINELLCTMAVFAYDARRGEMKAVESVSTLPAGTSVQPGFSTAEVAVHPSGRFLYGSNRGHDTIVVYAIDAATGRLTLVQHEPTQGKTPRHFGIDPTGAWLLAENQGSDTVVVFGIDAKTGRLSPTGQRIEVPSPVCAVFVKSK